MAPALHTRPVFNLYHDSDLPNLAGQTISRPSSPRTIPLGAPDKPQRTGLSTRWTGKLDTTDDSCVFATLLRKGFRPGLPEPSGRAAGPNGFTVPLWRLIRTDVENSNSAGKTELFDNSLRTERRAFLLRSTTFRRRSSIHPSPNLSLRTMPPMRKSRRGRRIHVAPASVDGLTWRRVLSFLDTEVTEVLHPDR